MNDTDQIAAEAFRKITEAGASSNPDTFIAIIKSAVEKRDQQWVAAIKGEGRWPTDVRVAHGTSAVADASEREPFAKFIAKVQATSEPAHASEQGAERCGAYSEFDGVGCYLPKGHEGEHKAPSGRIPATASELEIYDETDARANLPLEAFQESDSASTGKQTNEQAWEEINALCRPEIEYAASPSGDGHGKRVTIESGSDPRLFSETYALPIRIIVNDDIVYDSLQQSEVDEQAKRIFADVSKQLATTLSLETAHKIASEARDEINKLTGGELYKLDCGPATYDIIMSVIDKVSQTRRKET